MSITKSVSVAFRIDRERHAKLKRLAAATDRPRSWHLQQALDDYLDSQLDLLKRIDEGLSEPSIGKSVSHDVVMRRLRQTVAAASRRGVVRKAAS